MNKRSNEKLESEDYLFSQEYDPGQTVILGRSVLDLFRAFSNNSMVAFVGSGTSVALGYPTWGGFAQKLMEHVVEQWKITAGELGQELNDPKYAHSVRLAWTVTEYQRLFAGDDPNRKPALFDMIALASEMAAELRRIGQAQGKGASENSVEKFYRDTFCRESNEGEPNRALPAGDSTSNRVVNEMQKRLGQLAGATGTNTKLHVPMTIPPDYVAGTHLVRALNAEAAPDTPVPGAATEPSKDPAFPVEQAPATPTRGSIDPSTAYRKLLGTQRPSQDVLACLQGNWNINRFVTLNYDHEIERQLEDHTYPFFSLTPERGATAGSATAASATGGKPTAPGRTARSRLGESAVTIDLCPRNTAELLLFAANFSPAQVQVVHLHGSVRDPSAMIVTDRDYNQRYFSRGAWPSVLGDGQDLLFRGNAILFVGVGMTEDELLRPLRILAQAPTRDGRPVFALLASSSSEAEDTALAVKLFQRYGIRTIFYGRVPPKDDEFGNLSDHPLRRAYRAHPAGCDGGPSGESDSAELASLQDELDFLDCVQRVVKARKACKEFPDAAPASSDGAFARPDATDCAGAPETPVGGGEQDKKTDRRADLESQYAKARDEMRTAVKECCTKNTSPTDVPPADPYNVGRFGPIPTRKLPRLRLTPWHTEVFALVSVCMEKASLESLSIAQLKALADAVVSLRSAIQTRALLDALDFIAVRARDWRRNWSRYPGHAHCAPAFRRLPDSPAFPSLLRRHIGMHDNLGDTPAFDRQGASAPVGALLKRICFRRKQVVICLWPNGRGKGYLASLLASEPATDASRRVVISFNQSWEFDSCFDLIADVIRRSGRADEPRFECVLTHVDTIFNKAAKRPLLAEWDVLLRLLIASATQEERIRLIVVCEYPTTRDYFASIAGDGAHRTHGPGLRAPYVEAEARDCGKQLTGAEAQAKDLNFVFARCKSRWLTLFLCQLIDWVERRGRRRTPGPSETETEEYLLAPEAQPGEFSRRLINDAWNRLRQTQDPRQRVAAVIDVAIVHFERHVIAYGTPEVRLQKILAFALLRNLFVLATPVRPELIRYFPEIRKILKDYGEADRGADYITDAVALLEHLRLVIPLHGHYPATLAQARRIGLHGGTRRYLLSKKSLPFTHFGRREHAAITVLPVLAEDVVALEQDDFEFTRELFQGLVGAANAAISEREKRRAAGKSGNDAGDDACRVLPAECVRAAFGLLRGSMRLGIVLRAAETASPEHSPLDDYFRQLLSIRRAALRIADCDDPNWGKPGSEPAASEPATSEPATSEPATSEPATSEPATSEPAKPIFAWPLYEREWVWLFNEMGVVRLLQGDMRDACTLLEQAIDFEEKRLRRDAGFEQLLYQRSGEKRFSVTRLRIFMNLSTAALERGAFDRVSRIVQRDIANLRLNLRDFAPGDEPARAGKQKGATAAATAFVLPHRELEILTLVAGLIDARVQYLQGAIGGAEVLLRAQRRRVLKVGVHGLTAAFFKVYADVQQRKGDVARTMKYLAIARTEAQASCRTDVVLGVMLAEAEQARDTQAAESALQLRHHLGRLRKIEGEAQRIGLTQVEATVCLVRARLYLGFGEYRSAREDIMKALTMTTSKGMRVKRIAALVILAALMATEDTTDTARHEALQLLSTARAEAERMGYKLAAINAMELEIVLNRRGSVEDWATSRARVAMDARTASSVAG